MSRTRDVQAEVKRSQGCFGGVHRRLVVEERIETDFRSIRRARSTNAVVDVVRPDGWHRLLVVEAAWTSALPTTVICGRVIVAAKDIVLEGQQSIRASTLVFIPAVDVKAGWGVGHDGVIRHQRRAMVAEVEGQGIARPAEVAKVGVVGCGRTFGGLRHREAVALDEVVLEVHSLSVRPPLERLPIIRIGG